MSFSFLEEMDECELTQSKNVMVWLNPADVDGGSELRNKFFGTVLTNMADTIAFDFANKTVYLCGDAKKALSCIGGSAEMVFVVRQLVTVSIENPVEAQVFFINVGEVPLNVHGLGVFFPRRFADSFASLGSGHNLQDLRESDKESVSLRRGIYLSEVTTLENGDSEFNILRCSTNLDGSTEAFTSEEKKALFSLNYDASWCFNNAAPINHILMQKYENKDNKKGSIKDHSDKTEDMPANGVMAFVTTYDPATMPAGAKQVGFDWQLNGLSLCTRLRFCLKKELTPSIERPAKFDVLLYPGSVLLIPLSTNRMYTHTVKPSALPADKIPVRTSLVARCSKTTVVHSVATSMNYIIDNETGERVAMQPIDDQGRDWMREKYYEENLTAKVVDYGKKPIPFSMNKGDYLKPSKPATQ